MRAVAISEADEANENEAARTEEDQLLVCRLASGKSMSLADFAHALDWTLGSGQPYKSKVERVLKRLVKHGLIKKNRTGYDLSDKGQKAAEAIGVHP